MADWSRLSSDVWSLIGEKLPVAADRIRFRSVCPLWRSLVPFPQPPWLMLAENPDSPNTRGFFGLGDEELYEFEVPEVHEKRIVGSTGTWITTVDSVGMVWLLNPFSGIHVDLPPVSTFEYGFYPLEACELELRLDITPLRHRDTMLHKVVLSSPTPSSCIAMAIHDRRFKIAIARPGDARWTAVQTPKDLFEDIIFYRDQFYGINNHGCLMVCDVHSNPPKATLLTEPLWRCYKVPELLFYLVEWKEQLLFVIKCMCDDAKLVYRVDTFRVFIFDFTNKKWKKLNDLEEYSLFLGFNTSLAVLTSGYPRLRRNCIYFTDDYRYGHQLENIPGGHAMGIFDLKDESIVPLPFRGTSTSRITPPFWIVPPPHY